MPLYLCNAAKGAIDDDAKRKIAADVTRIHCDVTAAPPDFVHVFFLEESDFVPLNGQTILLIGSIRGGRTDEQKAQIVREIGESIRAHTGVAPDKTFVTTTDTPASWVMEGGDILPEPGEEDEWLVAHKAKIKAQS